MIEISTSILTVEKENATKTFYDLEVAGTDYYHIDIMDGKFVPSITYDAALVNNINQNTLTMLDVHLMCNEPLKIIDEYLKAGANILTIHYEAFKNKDDIMLALKKIKAANGLAGLSINPDTKIKDIKVYLHDFDIILLMSVQPGASGQKLLPETFERLQTLNNERERNDLKFKIEVDGGVNNENAQRLVECGADILVSGNYIYKSNDRKKAINILKNS